MFQASDVSLLYAEKNKAKGERGHKSESLKNITKLILMLTMNNNAV